MYSKLIKTIQQYTALDNNEVKLIKSKFKKVKIKKNEFLSDKIVTPKVLIFVNSGALHQINLNNDSLNTLHLISTYKFAYATPKELQAITDTSLLYITDTTLSDTFLTYTNLQNIFNKIIYQYMEDYIEEINFLRSEHLPQKIIYIKQRYSYILQFANDSIIASYLGVSRETYSRNKKKFL
ncbi:MAG: hypothetical protein Q4B43_03735 [Bacteroidota bacterium]|nr:hypothetical protein [Bacteroidota bacterium]